MLPHLIVIIRMGTTWLEVRACWQGIVRAELADTTKMQWQKQRDRRQDKGGLMSCNVLLQQKDERNITLSPGSGLPVQDGLHLRRRQLRKVNVERTSHSPATTTSVPSAFETSV